LSSNKPGKQKIFLYPAGKTHLGDTAVKHLHRYTKSAINPGQKSQTNKSHGDVQRWIGAVEVGIVELWIWGCGLPIN